jgi:hypothetical protein
MLVDKTATGKKRSIMYSLIDIMDKVPIQAHQHRFRTPCSAIVILTSSDKLPTWRKEVRDIAPNHWRILYIITRDDLVNSDFDSADLIIVNRNLLRNLGTDSLGTITLQFRIVVFDDVDKLVYDGPKKLNTGSLTRRTIIAKTLFCGDNNILLSSGKLSFEPGSNHLDTCLYLVGIFQNKVSIYPGPISPRDMFMADPQNRQDIFDGNSASHFVLQEDQKLHSHSYFLKHHVLQPLPHDVEPDTVHLMYSRETGNILTGSLASEINACPIMITHPTRTLSIADIALIKTVAYVASRQSGTKVAIFSGLSGYRNFYSWYDIVESLKNTDGIKLLRMDLPCTDYKRKRKSMEDDTKKNVLVFEDHATISMIPHFPSLTHIIVPWKDGINSNNRWTKVYTDFVNYATRYGVMVNKPVVIIKISGNNFYAPRP